MLRAAVLEMKEELRQRHFKRATKLFDRSDGNAFLAALDGAHVSPVESATVREFLLRKARFGP